MTSYRRDSSYNLTSHTFMVEFESLLYRGDGSKHREPVDSAFNVGCSAKLISQHLGHSGDLVLRWDDQGYHTRAIPERRSIALNPLLKTRHILTLPSSCKISCKVTQAK